MCDLRRKTWIRQDRGKEALQVDVEPQSTITVLTRVSQRSTLLWCLGCSFVCESGLTSAGRAQAPKERPQDECLAASAMQFKDEIMAPVRP